MPESRSHRWMKDYAAKLLKEKYNCDRIEFEYPFLLMNNRGARIDVVGFKGADRYAVECGNNDEIKLDKLKHLFKEVIHLDYETVITILLNEAEMLRKQAESQPQPIYIGKRQVKSVNIDFIHNKIALVDPEGKVIATFDFQFKKGDKNSERKA